MNNSNFEKLEHEKTRENMLERMFENMLEKLTDQEKQDLYNARKYYDSLNLEQLHDCFFGETEE